jgi:hypothetical protein
MGTGSFPGVKRPGRCVDHPLHLAPRVKKECSYTSTPPSGPSWSVLGWTLPLNYQHTLKIGTKLLPESSEKLHIWRSCPPEKLLLKTSPADFRHTPVKRTRTPTFIPNPACSPNLFCRLPLTGRKMEPVNHPTTTRLRPFCDTATSPYTISTR